MKLEFLANINNFIKKNTGHQIRHFSKARRKKKKEVDYPMAVGIWANKYDMWGEKYKSDKPIDKHEIFEPFKYGMRQLNDKGIPCFKYIVSAKSDPEMVYRGITTMIKDY